MRFRFFWSGLALFAALTVPAQASLIITPTFGSSITSDPNASVIEASINDAINLFETTYTNNITIPIFFQEGGGLGGSEFYYYTAPYAEFYAGLVTNNANPAAIAGLTANGGAGANNPVNGTSNITIKSANARAVGFDAPAQCLPGLSGGTEHCTFDSAANNPGDVDGIITLNTNITYPPQGNNGSNYGLVAVAEHEIDEILGLGSSLVNTTSGTVAVVAGNPAPEDLFRYNVNGQRTFGGACGSLSNAYFSYSGATDLAQFNNSCNGADFADWASGASPQVQDAFGTPGANPAYGSNEIAALSAVGYDLAAPEPGTWILLAATAGLGVALKRRP